ncbi:MAG TPA: hypothetical protein VG146_05115 [Verrucomicrobiae bacterium]|nr:hypothetical protein [Verrucomicrobiae bacterium]
MGGKFARAERGKQQTPIPGQTVAACFLALPNSPLKALEELFRAKVIHLLVQEQLLPPERVQVLYSWKHSGFNVHAGEPVPPEAKSKLEELAQYILRNPFSVEKMTRESPTGPGRGVRGKGSEQLKARIRLTQVVPAEKGRHMPYRARALR